MGNRLHLLPFKKKKKKSLKTLKLVMTVSAVPLVMITDMKECKLKVFTLAFAAKQTHSSVKGRAVYFSESHLCSTPTLQRYAVSKLIQ